MTDEATWWRGEWISGAPEEAASALWSAGAGGVEVRDATTFFEGSPDFAPVPDGKTRLIGYFEVAPTEHAQARLRDDLDEDIAQVAQTELVALAPFEDDSWKTKWREFFHPRPLSPHAMVGPPWEDFEAPEGGHTIVVEPGMAFGTGTHETTQLCAAVLEELLTDEEASLPDALLDVGCGSGILSMHALKLGVPSVLGLDIAEEALENARHNLGLNDLTDADVTYAKTPLAQVEGQWTCVVANILAHILIDLSDDLIAHTAPGGTLILSGLLTTQLDEVRAAFAPLEERGTRTHGEWCALIYHRPHE